MNLETLMNLVDLHTEVYRKGEVVNESQPGLINDSLAAIEQGNPLPGGVIEIFGYPHESEIPSGVPSVDMIFVTVGVDVGETTKQEFIEYLGDGVFPEYGTKLTDGPSYIHLGGELGSQEGALRFMAMGKTLGLWEIADPRTLGITDEDQIRRLAGSGLLYAVGWKLV